MRFISYAVLVLLLVPLLLSVLVSFTPSRYLELPRTDWTFIWYRQFFESDVWVHALRNSLAIAVLTSALSTIIALATAVAFIRHRFRWKGVCEGALLLPLVLPAVCLGAGMLALVRLTPLWGSHLSLALAHSILAVPVSYLVLRASLRQLDPGIEAAARGLGANSWQVFRHVTLPLIMPGILASTLFGLIISLNEITLTLFLATRDTETLPRVIWPNLRFALTPLVAAASMILLAVTLPALLTAGWWLRPRRDNR